MNIKLVYVFFLIIPISCITTKNTQNSSNEPITIKIKNPETNKISRSLRLNINFEVTNNSNEDIYFPKPVAGGEWPDYYNLDLIPGENCMAMDMELSEQYRKQSSFEIIPKKTSKEFSFNPSRILPGIDCEYQINDTIQLALEYKPDPKYLDFENLKYGYRHISDQESIKEIYSKIPRDTFKSQLIELIIE